MQNYWENFTVLDLIFPHNSLSAFPKPVLFHKNTFLLGGKSRLGVSAGQIRGSGIWGILRGGSSSSPSYKVGRRRSKLLRIAGYQRLKLSTNSKSRFRVCKIILIPRNLQLKRKKNGPQNSSLFSEAGPVFLEVSGQSLSPANPSNRGITEASNFNLMQQQQQQQKQPPRRFSACLGIGYRGQKNKRPNTGKGAGPV